MKNFILILFILLLNFRLSAQIDFTASNLITHELLSEMDQRVSKGDYEEITSILIAKDGKLVYEKYYNDASDTSLHNTRSATKTIATFLTGIAIDKGFISSEKDKIFPYLKHKMPVQNPDLRKEQITIEDLLTMSAIVECNDNDEFSRGNENRMYIVEDWTKFYLDLPVRGYPYSLKPEDSPYGRAMSYCSAGSALITEVVQSAIKMKADKFLEANFLLPLEITNYKLDYNPKGMLNTAGGSEYQSKDLLKMVQLCLQKGLWNGKQIIASSWIEKAITPKANAWEEMDYGYLLWLRSFDGVFGYAMAGNGGNKAIAFPELNLTVVLTTTNYNNRKAHGYTDELLEKYIIPAIRKQ